MGPARLTLPAPVIRISYRHQTSDITKDAASQRSRYERAFPFQGSPDHRWRPAMTSAAAPALSVLGETTLRKVRRRLMPLIVLLYFVAYLDRNNVGFAKLGMQGDIGLTEAA